MVLSKLSTVTDSCGRAKATLPISKKTERNTASVFVIVFFIETPPNIYKYISLHNYYNTIFIKTQLTNQL